MPAAAPARARVPTGCGLALALALALALLLAGCTGPTEPAGRGGDAGSGERAYEAMGFTGQTWPWLEGHRLTVLSYDSFAWAFESAKEAFENLTGARVELVTVNDAGQVLERAVREKGDPSFDVLYGIDNVLMGRALEEGVFDPYEPLLSGRVNASLAFLPDLEATPVNHGYIAVNVDPRAGLEVEDLDDVRNHAALFVTQDPRTSTPGLGFLIATVAVYGEPGYLDYWQDLFDGGVLVTPGWSEAYVQHFSGGYGQFEEGTRQDRAIVTSYTTSPAYEAYYGYETLNGVVLAPGSTFHQVQTMGIAKGAPNRVAAEAWIEFTLTDAFQRLAAEAEAIYPVADGVGVADVFGGDDPAPGTFEPAPFTHEELAEKVPVWLRAWTDAYERSRV